MEIEKTVWFSCKRQWS